MALIESNPFAILTFIAAPAILTNASSVLALGTSNRFARNVDRARVLIKMLEGRTAKGDPETQLYVRLLDWTSQRTRLLVRALSAFYFAIGGFAAGSLMSLLGAIIAPAEHSIFLWPVLGVALLSGVAGLLSLVLGGSLLVRETRWALRAIEEEAKFYRGQFADHAATSSHDV
jgi:hypothetical protein